MGAKILTNLFKISTLTLLLSTLTLFGGDKIKVDGTGLKEGETREVIIEVDDSTSAEDIVVETDDGTEVEVKIETEDGKPIEKDDQDVKIETGDGSDDGEVKIEMGDGSDDGEIKIETGDGSDSGEVVIETGDSGGEINSDDAINGLYGDWKVGADKFRAVLKKAKKDKTPMILYFQMGWCGYCTDLNSKLSDSRVQELLKDIPKVTIFTHEKNYKALDKKLAKKFKVKGFPSFFIISPKSINKREKIGGVKEYDSDDLLGYLHYSLGELYRKDKKLKEAQKHHKEVLTYSKIPFTIYNSGIFFYNLGAKKEIFEHLNLARKFFKRYKELKPNDDKVDMLLAQIEKSSKFISKKGIETDKTNIKVGPKDDMVSDSNPKVNKHNRLGMKNYKKNRYKLALKHFGIAYGLNKKNSFAAYGLAISFFQFYKKSGDKKYLLKSKKFHNLSLSITPNRVESKKALKEIDKLLN